jgi:hypothetical protein
MKTTTPTTPRELALAEVRLVARALVAAGGTATAEDVAAAGGLDPGLVRRRLRGAGLCAPGRYAVRYFAYTPPPGLAWGAKGKPGVWGLTSHGRELAGD